jgi:hypothetical protein
MDFPYVGRNLNAMAATLYPEIGFSTGNLDP